MDPSNSGHNPKQVNNIRLILSVIGAFVLFLFALDLMISSLQHLSKTVTDTILLATSNPFTGLFIGLLITAMLQSSSTTTSLTVALVASGSITIQNAIPIIMGANVGTTITSTIVSLSFINKKKEFKRAVTAGTYHDFFNILTVVVLFPLEYYNGFLSNFSVWITDMLFVASSETVSSTRSVWPLFSWVISFLVERVPNAFILTVVAVALLFSSILIFRKLISDLLEAKSPEVFSRFFFKSPLKSFLWGVLTTAAIRSSTITTSVVVPIVAKKVATLKQAAPFIMGANVGTTVTAFIAAILNSNTSAAISIAIAHFLFNFIGVCLFFPIPLLRKLPIYLANSLGNLTLKYRLAGFVYLLLTFFFIPFSLIYFNQDSTQRTELVYEKITDTDTSYYRIYTRINLHTQRGEWLYYSGKERVAGEGPVLIYPVVARSGSLAIGKDLFIFADPGGCWTGQNETGSYNACLEQVRPYVQSISGIHFDSVYVFSCRYQVADSVVRTCAIDYERKIVLRQETTSRTNLGTRERLIGIKMQ